MINPYTFSTKAVRGLPNLGNTCFMNAVLQVLCQTASLNRLLDTGRELMRKMKNGPDSFVLFHWNELRKKMQDRTAPAGPVNPKVFLQSIQTLARAKGAEQFVGFAQNDVGEFLIFLVDCFHNSLSREIEIDISGQVKNDTDKLALKCFTMIRDMYARDYSEMWSIFYGTEITEIVRMSDNEVLSLKPEPFFMLDLPIPPDAKQPTLMQCLDHYVAGEILDDYREEASGQLLQVRKRIKFWSFPEVLAIDIKRFNQHLRKNHILVDFPFTLDLSSYVSGYKKQQFQYELFGVCNHSGNVGGGHYTASVKSLADNRWYHCNDTLVTPVHGPQEIVNAKAYVLFYQKVVTPSSSPSS